MTALRDEYEAKYAALEKQYQDRSTQLPPELANMFAAKNPARRGLPMLGRVDPVERSYGPELTEREANMPNQWQQAIWLQAEPIMRKIASNPKALLIYNYLQGQYDYDKDYGGFLMDCVDIAAKKYGVVVRIGIDQEVT